MGRRGRRAWPIFSPLTLAPYAPPFCVFPIWAPFILPSEWARDRPSLNEFPHNALWTSHPFPQKGVILVAIYSDAVELWRAGKNVDLRRGREAGRVAARMAHKDVLDGKSRGSGGGPAFFA